LALRYSNVDARYISLLIDLDSKPIGSGATADVWLGKPVRRFEGKKVAIKVLNMTKFKQSVVTHPY
jgi:hypothetical protein